MEDYLGAISDSNEAIEINPSLVLSYLLRGQAKAKLKDIKGACLDIGKAMELDTKGYKSKIIGVDIYAEWLKEFC